MSERDMEALVKLEAETLFLAGKIAIHNVHQVYAAVLSEVPRFKKVDCSGLHSADSSLLALLLWLQAQKDSQPLKVQNVPDVLVALLQLYDLESVLHIQTA